ncbi:DNA-binding protein [Dickeya dadantii]|uniref:DNA-binding protein n=1 Tax=Dickeya dadantii TaxID=204038 RepID=UPI00137361D8|nr:DNA-binding protein [Dickeya dadantii]NAT78444.1 DNA-binding protein [Dickeya dadantii]NPE63133.1 DNA-binding protein [Dickeya dadantii]
MSIIDFKHLHELSSFQLQQYIDDNNFTPEQRLQIFEHYHSKHKDTTNIYQRKENIKSIKKDVDYVHLFTKNFECLAELDITKTELKVIAKILNKMEFGNLFHISQAALCRDLGIGKSNMSLIFKKLKTKGIIIDKDGDLFMNSNIFLKGQAHSINMRQRPNVKKAQGFNANNEPAFDNVYTFNQTNDSNNHPTEGTTASEPPKTSDSCSDKETDPALTLQYPKTAEPVYDDVE